MSLSRALRFLRAVFTAGLTCALTATTPGFGSYAAAAQVIRGGAGAVSVVPVSAAYGSGLTRVSTLVAAPAPLAPALLTANAAPAQAIVVSEAAPVPAAGAPVEKSPDDARHLLTQAAARLSAAGETIEKGAVIDALFDEGQTRADDALDPAVANPPAARRLSGLAKGLGAAGRAALAPWRAVRGTAAAITQMCKGDAESREFMKEHNVGLTKARLMHMADVPVSLFLGWGLGHLIDMATEGASVPGALVPFVALSASVLVTVLLDMFKDLKYELGVGKMEYEFIKTLRVDLFRRIFRFPQKFFDQNGHDPESLAGRISDDVNHADDKNVHIPIKTPVHLLSIAGGMAMLAWTGWTALAGGAISPWLVAGIVALLVFVLISYGVVSAYSAHRQEEAEESYQTKHAEIVAHAQQALESREVYLAMGLEDQAIALFEQQAEHQARLGKTLVNLSTKLQFWTTALGMPANLLVTFAIAWSLFLIGAPTVGVITAIVHYTLAVSQGAEGLAKDHAAYRRADGGTKKIDEIRRLPMDLDSADATDLGPFKGRIEFRDVTFRYADGAPALKNVSFMIEPGETVAFVGPSGAGKSTILKMISRLYRPDSGQVLVDGVDINKIKIRGLREQLAVVPQESGLFDASVERNLLAVKPGASAAEIEAALKGAGALEFVREKSNGRMELGPGLETNVHEFSGGQRQRISIARALLRNSPLLMLDEWASALDHGNEKKINAVLNAMRKNRTTLIVDHKLHFDKAKTKIVLMLDGKIADVGRHSELLKRSPVYAEIVKTAKENLDD